ncbi:tudor domain-containing protein 1 [Halyomorpha halys]|uniref:tudor domain-containing protein 1 n=1 Tax=Halyomorpha halys TaxID=286706 RepID=UPI0006D4CA29|nr:tudor domain-containing protein 1 [Halyomorpha halys]
MRLPGITQQIERLIQEEGLRNVDIVTDELNGIEKAKVSHWSFILNSLPKEELPKLVYKDFEILPGVNSLIGDVTAYLTPILPILHIEDVEGNPTVHKMRENFKELSNEMQIEGPHQPLLQHPYKYKACCAMYSLDEMWYRGFVLEELPDKMMLVQYVDYGNVEVVPASCVRELREEWIDVEVQGILCTLHNVDRSEYFCDRELLDALEDCLQQGTVKANIIERKPDLSVELLINERLAYQKLIDMAMFSYID